MERLSTNAFDGDQPFMLVSERLILRQWQRRDLEPFAAMNADPQVMEHFPAPLDTQQSNALAGRLCQLIARDGWGFWAVETRSHAEFIGFVGLRNISDTSDAMRAMPFGSGIEIGWRLAHAHWGKGYATEAAGRALRFGFEELALPEIVSFTALPNLPSQAVMRKLGMRRDPRDFDHPGVPEGHALRRHCLYRLARSIWQEWHA
ncbi:GNAT family N-acetyltransferase [Noviherbaspirillum aerium]|uniref:GNAT family N-acetyltransferase n=1 Tax=Noviherbaspirillum aerium TaxID=2588497 RepID=UPI001CEF6AF0|nr:GNAT family N-acetyltransferase [Noviherbaspirillum aerium]